MTTLPDLDSKTDQPNGEQLLGEEDWRWIENSNLTIKFIESFTYEEMDNKEELHFECWLDFDAEDDTKAIKKFEKVLDENGFDWIQVCFLLEKYTNRKVYSVGIEPVFN